MPDADTYCRSPAPTRAHFDATTTNAPDQHNLPFNQTPTLTSPLPSLSPLIRVLNERPDLDITDRVTVRRSAENLHAGGFGDVYDGICKQADTGQSFRVAIKRIRNRGGSSHEEFAKLLKAIAREIRIWSELNHPNVLPLLGYIIEGMYPSLVSVWMNYGSLYAFMQQNNLNAKDSLAMALDIACGLAYLHSRSAIHSDLKSDNVLVTPERHAVLADFGASRMETLSSGYSTASVVGSLRWTAIEFFYAMDNECQTHFTKGTDVWAFGMTVYEVLSKSRPYAHLQCLPAVLGSIIRGEKPRKPAVSDNPSDAKIENFMWSICENCWQTDPKSRSSISDIELRIREEIDRLDF